MDRCVPGAFEDADPDERRRCQNCGEPVSQTWRVVAGDEEGRVHRCIHCPGSQARAAEQAGHGGEQT